MGLTPLRIDKDPGESRRRNATSDGAGGESCPASPSTPDANDDYSRHGVLQVVRDRGGWLIMFCLGLLVSAVIVQRFEDLLEHHVQLSFFVPLIMGHGGNTGSQTVSMIIRALALHQVHQRDLWRVVAKEATAGGIMGALIGTTILLFSLVWPNLTPGVGLSVAVAMPIISMWANGTGAFLTMIAARFKFDPAVTSVPLMTTIVDATGLVIYFYIATLILDIDLRAVHKAEHVVAGASTIPGTKAAATAASAAVVAGKVAGGVFKKLMSPPPPVKAAAKHGKGFFL